MTRVYFASDFHLGVDARLPSRERERQIVRWLDHIRPEASELFLVGDVFDFWFEYHRVVPKGHTRLLGRLAEWTDSGVPVSFFTGNHDMWIFRYFEEELGIPTHRQPIVREIGGKTFFIGHGDGLGPGDYGYKRLKKIFASPSLQWMFARLHPNLGIGLANFWSGRSRQSNPEPEYFLGPDKEWLVAFCEEKSQSLPADYFVFGHRHLPIDYALKNGKSRYINLGDWTQYNSYGVFDGNDFRLEFFENPGARIFP